MGESFYTSHKSKNIKICILKQVHEDATWRGPFLYLISYTTDYMNLLWWPRRANLDFEKKKQRNLNCEIKQNLSYEIKQNLSLEEKTESLFRNKTEFKFWNKIGSDFRNKTESHFQNKTESHFRKKIGSHFSVHIWMNIFKPKLKRLFALRHSYKKHAFLMLTQSMLTSRQTCTINYIWLTFLWHLQLFTDFLLG